MTTAITSDLIARSGGLLRLHPEVSTPHYSMFNGGSVEVEVAEFLYGFVRLTKPFIILETGTHVGVSSAYMAEACRENGLIPSDEGPLMRGGVLTWEYEAQHVAAARQLHRNLGLTDWIHVTEGDSAGLAAYQARCDMAFLDTEPNLRFQELLLVYPRLKPGGFIFIHDLHRHMGQVPNPEHGFAWPFGTVPEDLTILVREGKLRVVHFENPRGMTMFAKVQEGTYAW